MSSLENLGDNPIVTCYVETHVYNLVTQDCTNIEYEFYELYYNRVYGGLIENALHHTILSLQLF